MIGPLSPEHVKRPAERVTAGIAHQRQQAVRPLAEVYRLAGQIDLHTRRHHAERTARRIRRNTASLRSGPTRISDFTYVSSWQGMVYVAFVIDVFARKIVGWRVSTSMTTGFVLDALNQAICQRAPSEADKLIHHSDSQKMVASSWAA